MIAPVRGFWILITLFAVGCGSNRPSAPNTGSGGGSPASVTGKERIGWDQPSADAGILGSLHYAIYVDNVRNEVADAACAASAGAAGFPCSGQLPAMTAGAHTLEIAAFTLVGSNIVEGNRSGSLQVVVSAAVTAGASLQAEWQNTETEPTRDGLRFRIEKLAEGFDRPVDAAFAPDERLFIVDRRAVRILSGVTVQDPPALSLPDDDPSQQLLSIAFDPDFERTRFVFVLQTMDSREGPVVYLARYREVRGILGQRALVFQAAATGGGDPSAVMRFGPDRKLYVAVGSDDSNGKVFRLNPDGTMPGDQTGTSPAVAGGVAVADGFAWDPRGPIGWIVDNDASAAHLSAISLSPPPVRAIVRAREDLPPRLGSVVFYTADAIPELGNNALIASREGYILRLRFAADDLTRVADSEKILDNQVGPVHVLVTAPNGTIYFCTERAVGRLTLAAREK